MIPTTDELRAHCRMAIDYMESGSVIPFFGAGVNRSERPPHTPFSIGKYLPDAEELSESIATLVNYPWPERDNLLRVAWYAANNNQRTLYQHLHEIFSAEYPTTTVHDFFAQLPGKLSAKGYPNRFQLIVTTNYDEVLENAFVAAKEPYDLLTYIANSSDKREIGKFRYIPHGGTAQLISKPTSFPLPIDEYNVLERTMILKIHGAVDKIDWRRSSFVVTEDDYIDYLARMNTPARDIPSLILQKMRDSSFLFLGYSLSDWNMRVLLNSIWSTQTYSDTSWAVMHKTKEWDEAYWQKHRVQLLKLSLKDYVAALDEQLDALPVNSRGVSS
jgi:hypothetical protein